MWNATVDDVRSRHAALERDHAAFHFRNHSAFDDAFFHQAVDVRHRNARNERSRIVHVLQYSRNVRELHEFFRLERDRDFRRSSVGIDIVKMRIADFARSNRGNNRNEIFLQKRSDDFGMNLRHLAHVAEIHAVLFDFFRAKQA